MACLGMAITPKLAHCWPIISFLRKLKNSVAANTDELSNLDCDVLIANGTVDGTVLEESAASAAWVSSVACLLVGKFEGMLDDGCLTFMRDGKSDKVPFHLIMAAPQMFELINQLRICKGLGQLAQAEYGIKNLAFAEQATEKVILNIAAQLPELFCATNTMCVVHAKLKAVNDTVKVNRQLLAAAIITNTCDKIVETANEAAKVLLQLPMSANDIDLVMKSTLPFTTEEETALYAVSHSDRVFLHTYFHKFAMWSP